MSLRQRFRAAVEAFRDQPAAESRGVDLEGALAERLFRLNGLRGPQTLTLTAAYACIDVVSSDIGALSCKLFRKRKSGSREEVTQDDTAELVQLAGLANRRASEELSAFSHRQTSVLHMLGWGNSYCEIERQAGRAVGLHLLSPKTEPRRNDAKQLFYRDPDQVDYPSRDVLHIRGLAFDGIKGYSPPSHFARTFDHALAAEVYGLKLFENGALPQGILTTEQSLDEVQRELNRKNWNRAHQGPNRAGNIAVLAGGLKFQATAVSPEDAQYLDLRRFHVVEVCRIYRVPPFKVQEYTNANRSTLEESNSAYFTDSLLPRLVQIEQEYTHKLLSTAQRNAGLYFEFLATSYLRGNMQARAQFYKELFMIGAMSIADINRAENLNPPDTPAANSRFVPLNMVPLERALDPKPATPTGA